jgi:hypothetical protein
VWLSCYSLSLYDAPKGRSWIVPGKTADQPQKCWHLNLYATPREPTRPPLKIHDIVVDRIGSELR